MKGSIREKQHKDGKVFYEVVMEFKDPATGKRVQRSKSFAKEREAKKFLASFQVEQEKGADVQPSRLTLAELLHQWLAEYARVHVGVKTYEDYEATIRVHVILAIGGVGAEALKTHWARQNEHRLQPGAAWVDNGLIFPSSMGTPIWPDNLTRDYNRVIELAGVPRIRVHDIRHTAATLAIKLGANMLAVSKQLGHAGPSITTNIYGHVDAEMQRGVSSAVASAMFGGVVVTS
jgi:hypothetical protein